MLPFRRSNRVITLDDADIVESSDLNADASAIDVELDLDDALEISVASNNVKRTVRRAPYESAPDVEEVTVARRPLSSSSMKAMTPSRTMVPALVPNSSLSYGAARPSTFEKAAPVMLIPRAVVQDAERVTSGIPANHLTPSPSPFARSIIMNGTAPKAIHLVTESIAPVAITVDAEDSDAFDRAKTHGKPSAKIARQNQRREDADVDALVSASRGMAPRALRAVGLMLAGAVAAATMTAFAMRDDHDGQAAATQNTRTETSHAAALSPTTFVVPMTPVIRDSVASGMNADVNGAAAAPVQVKFDESDAVLVTASPLTTLAPTAGTATTDSASPVSAAKTMAAATALASASATGATPASSTHVHSKHRAQPTSTGTAPSNALVPDGDSPRRELPKMSPANGAKDPLAEAQLRAAMR